MRSLFKSYLRFSRVERLGIAALSLLLLILMAIRCSLSLWLGPPPRDPELERRMGAAYEAWHAQQKAHGQASLDPDPPEGVPAGELFVFDPNLLDSAGFIRLGMPARAVKGLLNWRRAGKRFYRPEDLRPLYHLPEESYARLAPYIRISAGQPSDPRPGEGARFPPPPEFIDLNTADSALLDRAVQGIGATLARRIVARRTALGGFRRHEQLLEVYKFPDTTFEKMRKKLRIDPGSIKKLHLNSAGLDELSAHPYLGNEVARHILMYREGIGKYERIEQLRQVPLMSEEIYRKIAPYFTVD